MTVVQPYYTYVRWLAYGLIAILISLIWRAGRGGKPREEQSRLIFRPSLIMQAVFALGVILFASLIVGFAIKIPFKEVWWIELGFLACLLLVVFSWPYSLVLDQHCISASSSFLQKKSTKINWASVDAVIYEAKKGKTHVTSKDGIEIVHHPYHIASTQFREIVSKRSGVKVFEVSI